MTVTATPPRATRVGRIRVSARHRSTPLTLRLVLGGVVTLIVATGIAGVLITVQRQDATSRAWQSAEPLMVTAQSIDTSLSDADTTAAASFLQGRLVPVTLEQRYQSDLSTASAEHRRSRRSGRLRLLGDDPAPPTRRRSPHLLGHRQDGGVQRAPGLIPSRSLVPRGGEQPHAGVAPSRLGRPL